MKFLEWKKDKWMSENGTILKYDKAEHYLLGIIGIIITYLWGIHIKATPEYFSNMFVVWVIIAILYEISNGIIPYDGTHIEGFSWKDLIAGFMGILSGIFIFKLIILAGVIKL